ncbi:MAG TPA: hypothetical protein VLX91_06670 [Candidatus Acidoferrales bacterium]|nr:hypothetical protein [Candidatus Acidoferrales bacterium]
MRYLLVALAALLAAFSPTSSVTFSDGYPRASSGTDGITITWVTSQENGIKDFAVEKASQLNSQQFYQLDGTIAAQGAGNTYQFTDKDLYKTTSSTIFAYRVRADGNDGSVSYSATITQPYDFSPGLSGVAKRTWGSIKAMFR